MARPIFTHELIDPDFSWLLSTFKENHPEYSGVEVGGLPIVMFKVTPEEMHKAMSAEFSDSDLLPTVPESSSEGPEESK